MVGGDGVGEERPGGRDQQRVDDAPAERGVAPHGGKPAVRDRARELRVEQLVGQDPRARRGQADGEAHEHRQADDGSEVDNGRPRPDGRAMGALACRPIDALPVRGAWLDSRAAHADLRIVTRAGVARAPEPSTNAVERATRHSETGTRPRLAEASGSAQSSTGSRT